VPTPTLGPCGLPFTDVHPADFFWDGVVYLFCNGDISGYPDNTFRPGNTATRSQLAKIVVQAENMTINTQGGPHFSDVATNNVFYPFVETAYNANLIDGYSDGTFKPQNNITRGQLSKIVVQAEQWAINTGGGPHFSDVPVGSTFYSFVETAFNHGILNGYADGTFKPNNPATRGQIAKVVHAAVTAP
jgi:hypothetical protein